MLRELRVRNLALLEDVTVPFAPGFCAVTGATGSGKSLILAALDLLLGGRFAKEKLRTGADEARVEGVFDLAAGAARAGIAEILGDDADELVLKRRVDASGKNRCEANGSLVPVATLRAIGRLLCEAHGQGESAALTEPAEQLALLDRYAGLDADRAAFADALAAWRAAKEREDAALRGSAARDARLASLRDAAAEIRKAKVRPGELEELRRERALLADAGRHAESVASALSLTDDDEDGAITRLGRAARALAATSELDSDARDALAALEDAASRASDAARSLRAAADRIEANPARLETVDDRIEELARMLRRHGPSEEDALRALADAERELGGDDGASASPEKLAADVRRAAEAALRLGRDLDRKRAAAGKKLAAAVAASLEELGMPGTRLAVEQPAPSADADPLERATSSGLSPVAFLASPNAGEDLRPLGKIASGGEAARIALALRGEVAGSGVPVLVFDEVDADVGPRMGAVIGARLARLSRGRQVIAVTHLAQVAEAADHHVRAAKHTEQGRTVTTAGAVTGRERERELADMRGEGRAKSGGSRG